MGVVFLPFPQFFFYPLISLCILFTLFPLLHRPLSLNLAVTLFTVIFTFLSQERWCSEVLMIGSGLIISPPIRATTICCMAFKPYTAAFHIYMFEMWLSITDPRRPAVLVWSLQLASTIFLFSPLAVSIPSLSRFSLFFLTSLNPHHFHCNLCQATCFFSWACGYIVSPVWVIFSVSRNYRYNIVWCWILD